MITLTSLSKIHLNPNNPRIFTDAAIEKMVHSLKNLPTGLWANPVKLDANNQVHSGNLRTTAIEVIFKLSKSERQELLSNFVESKIKGSNLTQAQQRQSAEMAENFFIKKLIPTICTDFLSDEQIREYSIKDNLSFGDWDMEALKEQFNFEELDDWGIDARVWGDMDMEDYKAEGDNTKGTPTVEEDNYEMPEVEEIETDIVIGDLFELIDDNGLVHRMLCGDATKEEDIKILMNGEFADVVFTDPPYELEDNFTNLIVKNCKEDCHIFIMSSDKKCVEFINNNSSIFKKFFAVDFRQARLVSNSQPMTRVDLIVELNKGKGKFNNLFDGFSTLIQCSKIHSDKVEQNFGHKQAKKVELPYAFISHYSSETELCVDFFGGSGTTLIASAQLKRRCYINEFEPKYCQSIINRFLSNYPSGAIKKIN